MGKQRRKIARLNRRNRRDADLALTVRTWQADGGTYLLRQRPSGRWEAEFTSDDEEEYIVALGATPVAALTLVRSPP